MKGLESQGRILAGVEYKSAMCVSLCRSSAFMVWRRSLSSWVPSKQVSVGRTLLSNLVHLMFPTLLVHWQVQQGWGKSTYVSSAGTAGSMSLVQAVSLCLDSNEMHRQIP